MKITKKILIVLGVLCCVNLQAQNVLTKEEAEYVCEMIIKEMETIVNLYSNGSSDIVLNFTPTEGDTNDMMVSRL